MHTKPHWMAAYAHLKNYLITILFELIQCICSFVLISILVC